MNPPPRKKEQSNSGTQSTTQQNHQTAKVDDIAAKMIKEIKSHNNLQNYPIRLLVQHTEDFGVFLKDNGLETNQIRKFLDAMNRAKDKLISLESDELIQIIENDGDRERAKFERLESELVFLKPKLFYAARQQSAESFKKVISEAIDKVLDIKDFKRLTELIEATVAYHTHHKKQGKPKP